MQPLRSYTLKVLTSYFENLGDESPSKLHEMVLQEVEIPLLQIVLEQTKGNQSKAAAILGLSRSTLHKKLKLYQLLNSIEN